MKKLQLIALWGMIATCFCFIVAVGSGILVSISIFSRFADSRHPLINWSPEIELAVVFISIISFALCCLFLKVWESAEKSLEGGPQLNDQYRRGLFQEELIGGILEGAGKVLGYGVLGLVLVFLVASVASTFLGVVVFIAFIIGLFSFLRR